MRRVLHIRSSGALLGAESVILQLAEFLPRVGYEAVIAATHDAGDPPPELLEIAANRGHETLVLPCPTRLNLAVPRLIRRYVAAQRIDLIHAHGYREDLFALASLTPVPKIATNHLWKRTTRRLAFYAAVDRHLLRRFDRVVAVSGPIERELERLGIERSRLSLIANGVDPDVLTRGFSSVEAADLRRSLGAEDDTVVIGMVSSLSIEKGHTHALSAFADLAASSSAVQLWIVGDGEERANLEAQVEELGLQKHVRFLGRRRDVPLVLGAIDVFVLASLIEGMPMALLEAMAAGKAVIATRVGDVERAVTHGRSGLLAEPGDPGSLAEGLRALVADSDLRRRVGEAAAAVVASRYTGQAMSAGYGALYDEVLGGRAEGRA